MNTERTVILENVTTGTIGLADTQGHMYRIAKDGKVRISAVILQDIFDHPGSKIIFREGMAKISNITREELYNMGLTEDEINFYLKEEAKPVVKEEIEKPIEEEKEETIKEEGIEEEIKEEPVIEETKEEVVVVKPKKTTKKSTGKKSTKKSSK